MTVTNDPLRDVVAATASAAGFGREQAEVVMAASDLVRIGMLGEEARRRSRGDEVTFGRVALVTNSREQPVLGDAGELRLATASASVDDAIAWVRAVATVAGAVPLSGFSLHDLAGWAGQDHLALVDIAQALRGAGLMAVSEVEVDRLDGGEAAADLVRAVRHGGLHVMRLVVHEGSGAARLDAIERAVWLQGEVGGFEAFAPLPRTDPAGLPSTGYEDAKTVAVARLWCGSVPRIQVDWPLYGPKLAQVALMFGADDIDGIAAVDLVDQGPRRTALEDIRRQIRSAASEPKERDGLFRFRA